MPDGLAVTLRPATLDDAELLLVWANDPVTRASGFHPRPIEPDEHRAWLAARLASAASRLYIGMAGGEPVGQLRLERGPDQTEISISIAPDARGRGHGRRLLAAGVAAARADPSIAGAPLIARVRPDNRASRALFGAAGFVEREQTTVEGEACLILGLR